MSISQIAIRRIVEEKADEDPEYRRQLGDRPLLQTTRAMSDEELLAKLESLGVAVDRNWLDRSTRRQVAAWAVAEDALSQFSDEQRIAAEDWVWLSLICLWERWFPDRPSMEKLDDLIHDGYDLKKQQDELAACRLWRTAWLAVEDIMVGCGVESIAEFEEAFGGTQSIFNWVQDYESALCGASQRDAEFLEHRVELCRAVLALCRQGPISQFERSSDLFEENFRRGLAECHFLMGDNAAADQLYEQWLKADPCWGSGWIGWSDAYFLFAADEAKNDPDQAIRLLKRGLDVLDVRDRPEVRDRLITVLEDTGRQEEAAKMRSSIGEDSQERRGSIEGIEAAEKQSGFTSASSELEVSVGTKSLRLSQRVSFGEQGLPLDQLGEFAASMHQQDEPILGGASIRREIGRVGRNEPCPCGSGAKYKKCCGRS